MHPRIWRQTFLTDLSHLYCLYVSLCTVCTITGWQWHQWDFEVVVPVHPNISFSVWDRFMSQFLWLHFFLFIWNYSGTYIWFNIHRLLCKTILLTQEAKILTALLLTSPAPQPKDDVDISCGFFWDASHFGQTFLKCLKISKKKCNFLFFAQGKYSQNQEIFIKISQKNLLFLAWIMQWTMG